MTNIKTIDKLPYPQSGRSIGLIGISGKRGSGKDTIANIILELCPEFVHEKFSFGVKQVVSIITRTSIEDNLSREGKTTIPAGYQESLGRLQQLVGEGMRKIVSDDVWIKNVLSNPPPYLVISDVRYPNEALAIQQAGGFIIRVSRDNRENDGRDDDHISETALDNYDENEFEHIENNGSMESLREKVKQVLKDINYVPENY